MANIGVRGQIVDENDNGIKDLTVRAVDFDPFFHEDDILKTGKTDGEGKFDLRYTADAYSFWKGDRKPDIVVQVFGPRYTDPKLFGTRLLHETKEKEDVTDEILDVGTIKIHRDNIDGWLVTHTTLNPESGTPVALFPGNEVRPVVDGAELFPALTDAASGANTSINLMALFFAVKDVNKDKLNLITKFKADFNPASPPSTNCIAASMEATLEEELKKQAKKPQPGKLVNVMVTDLPLTASDSVTEVGEFFKNTGVNTNFFKTGLAVLHGRAMTVDGVRAIVFGSSLKQGYFSDERHAIRDARHGGSLMHDVHLDISGPAVAQVDKTFATVWKATSNDLTLITPDNIPEKPSGDDVASVQVLRTMPGSTFNSASAFEENLPHGETGILEAYERAILSAERYIYIENQYFTSPEIINTLTARLKDSAKSKLQIILVLNFRPDLPGYADEQVGILFEVIAAARTNGHQIGMYTMWSRQEIVSSGGQRRFEIMPIYLHSKVAIIDDKWATVGSANLDGTSMNYHQIGLLASGAILDRAMAKFKPTDDAGKFLVQAFWYVFFFVANAIIPHAKVLLALLAILVLAIKLITSFDEVAAKVREIINQIRETLGDVLDIPGIVRETFTRTAPHALPHRLRQPPRSVELNVVIYNGIAGQPGNKVIHKLRERLWKEHLGLEALTPELEDVPADPADMKWVDFWNNRAETNVQMFRDEQSATAHTPKILPWKAQTEAEEYLRALKIRTKGLRNKADRFVFQDESGTEVCKLEEKKNEMPWPI